MGILFELVLGASLPIVSNKVAPVALNWFECVVKNSPK